jgi:hypothetical protein
LTRKQFAIIAARINEELSNISRLQNELKDKGFSGSPRAVKLAVAQADSFAIRGIGSVLHDFYVAIENIFEVIARDIDERLPSGENWHQELLRQMALNVPQVRPPLLQRDTAVLLDEFRAFRHVFRNVYGFNLSSARIGDLLKKFPDAVNIFQKEAIVFIDVMGQVLPGNEGSQE